MVCRIPTNLENPMTSLEKRLPWKSCQNIIFFNLNWKDRVGTTTETTMTMVESNQ